MVVSCTLCDADGSQDDQLQRKGHSSVMRVDPSRFVSRSLFEVRKGGCLTTLFHRSHLQAGLSDENDHTLSDISPCHFGLSFVVFLATIVQHMVLGAMRDTLPRSFIEGLCINVHQNAIFFPCFFSARAIQNCSLALGRVQ
jgi:hypothetical protein